VALEVKLHELPAPFDLFDGASMWVGEPTEYCENAGQANPGFGECGPAPGLSDESFFAASLQCEPYFSEWSEAGTIHVFHELIVPSGSYEVRVMQETCDPTVAWHMSDGMNVLTSRWGDTVSDCATTPCGPPDGSVNVTTDVTAILDKFKNLPGAPRKARCDLEPVEPDQLINITDVTYALDAFLGLDYPFTPGSTPPPCP
jgi:hypothetical protein